MIPFLFQNTYALFDFKKQTKTNEQSTHSRRGHSATEKHAAQGTRKDHTQIRGKQERQTLQTAAVLTPKQSSFKTCGLVHLNVF